MLTALCAVTLALPTETIVPGILSTGYAYVGKIREEAAGLLSPGSCVAIGSRYVLTARHMVGGLATDDDSFTITFGLTEYTSANVKRWPEQGNGQFDLAVVEIDRAFPQGQYYPIYTGSSELNLQVTMVGYGLMGRYAGGGMWDVVDGTYGIRRQGVSVVDSVFPGTIRTLFDGGPIPSYCMAAPGDSGGAVFATVSDQITLIGVPTSITGYPNGSEGKTYSQRVGAAHQWIMGFNTGFTLCHYASASQGTPKELDEQLIFYSDEIREEVAEEPPPGFGLPGVGIEFEGYAPHSREDVANLTFTIESRCTASPLTGLEQRILLYNFSTASWELVSTTTPSSTDTVVVATTTGDVKRFVQEGRELVRARVGWYEVGSIANPWKVEIDQVKWTVTQS